MAREVKLMLTRMRGLHFDICATRFPKTSECRYRSLVRAFFVRVFYKRTITDLMVNLQSPADKTNLTAFIMKKIILTLLVLFSISAYAGQKKLNNGSVAFWDDVTEVIQYNSYRVNITLTDKCDFDVWGTVYLKGTYGEKQANFIIPAGSTQGYADFEGLKNDTRYRISVSIRN